MSRCYWSSCGCCCGLGASIWVNADKWTIAGSLLSWAAGSLAVASADKIHNLSNMVSGLRAEGVVFASAFTAGLDAMVWYQRAVYDMLGSRWTHPMLDEHGQRLEAFRTAAAEVSQTPR